MKAPFLKFAPYMQAQSDLASRAVWPQLPAVTISRETAAGAVTIAKMVAKRLDRRFGARRGAHSAAVSGELPKFG